MDKANVWIVIAAFNEEKVIYKTVSEVRQLFENIVVCDDCSSDCTADEAFKAGANVLSHPINLGQGAALQTAIAYALQNGASYLVTFDADGQHSADEIEPMLQALSASGAEVALGSRFLNDASNTPRARKFLLAAALTYTKLTLGIKLTDVHNGFRVLSQDFCRKFEFKQNRMAHASEILSYVAKKRISFIEQPVTITYTDYSLRKGQKGANAVRILLEMLMGRVSK